MRRSSVALALLLVLAFSGICSSVTWPAGKIFVGYFESWSSDAVSATPWYFKIVNLSFMRPETTYVKGSLDLSTTGLDFSITGTELKDEIAALRTKNPGVLILISVGGATFINWAAFNPTNVADFVTDMGLDGVDIDYEPTNHPCSSSGGVVTCDTDTEYNDIITRMRAELPQASYVLSIAAFSNGAFGEGSWASSPPTYQAGMALTLLKTNGDKIDLVNIMAYDTGLPFDPVEALDAYMHYYSGRIAVGVEVPPEAWGDHVSSVSELNTVINAVNTKGAAGMMLWSIQAAGNGTSTVSFPGPDLIKSTIVTGLAVTNGTVPGAGGSDGNSTSGTTSSASSLKSFWAEWLGVW